MTRSAPPDNGDRHHYFGCFVYYVRHPYVRHPMSNIVLFFQGSVESLVKRIILRCFGTGEIMGDIQFLDSFPEIPGELGTVVCLDVFYLAV